MSGSFRPLTPHSLPLSFSLPMSFTLSQTHPLLTVVLSLLLSQTHPHKLTVGGATCGGRQQAVQMAGGRSVGPIGWGPMAKGGVQAGAWLTVDDASDSGASTEGGVTSQCSQWRRRGSDDERCLLWWRGEGSDGRRIVFLGQWVVLERERMGDGGGDEEISVMVDLVWWCDNGGPMDGGRIESGGGGTRGATTDDNALCGGGVRIWVQCLIILHSNTMFEPCFQARVISSIYINHYITQLLRIQMNESLHPYLPRCHSWERNRGDASPYCNLNKIVCICN